VAQRGPQRTVLNVTASDLTLLGTAANYGTGMKREFEAGAAAV